MLRDPGDPHEVWRAGRFEFAFRYPYSRGWRPLLWSAVMVVLGFLVLPLLALTGYIYRVCRNAVYCEERMPSTQGFLGLAWDGVRVLVVVTVYHLLLFIAAAVVLDPGLLQGEPRGPPAPAEVTEKQAAAVTAAFAVWLYGFAGVVTVFAATGSVVRTLLSLRVPGFVFTATYLKAWLLQIPVVLLLYVVGLVMALTVVGVFIWIPLFYMVLASYWGRTYFDGVNAGKLPPPEI